MEVPKSFLSTLKVGFFSSAQTGLAPESVSAVLAELEKSTPECWHTSRTPVVRVLDAPLRLAE